MRLKYFSLVAVYFIFILNASGQQATEAKTYQNYPLGMNMLQISYGRQTTNSTLDGDITLANRNINISPTITYLRYATFFKLFNKTTGVQVVLPYIFIDADFFGVEAKNSGFGDMIFVIGSNIFGGDPLTFEEFVQTRRKTILAWSLAVTAPTGSYATDKLLNPGSNRWQFKPELGLSVPVNDFDFELYVSGKFFTENQSLPAVIPGQTSASVKQSPFLGFTFHSIYNFNKNIWLSFDAASRFGGATRKNDVKQDDTQSVLGLGGSMNYSISSHHKLGISYMGVVTGNDNAPNGSVYSLKYSFMFGGGMDKNLKSARQ